MPAKRGCRCISSPPWWIDASSSLPSVLLCRAKPPSTLRFLSPLVLKIIGEWRIVVFLSFHTLSSSPSIAPPRRSPSCALFMRAFHATVIHPSFSSEALFPHSYRTLVVCVYPGGTSIVCVPLYKVLTCSLSSAIPSLENCIMFIELEALVLVDPAFSQLVHRIGSIDVSLCQSMAFLSHRCKALVQYAGFIPFLLWR